MSSNLAQLAQTVHDDDRRIGEFAPLWLRDFEDALKRKDRALLAELFVEDSYWRDLLALTWDLCQFHGRDAVREALFEHAASAKMTNLAIDCERTAPRVMTEFGRTVGEFFFAFDTAAGGGKGFLTLTLDETAKWGMRAYLLGTSLVTLDCAPEPDLAEHQPGFGFVPSHAGETWGEHRAAKHNFENRDPEVLIVGGSQSGASIGVHLDNMGVDYLIVEKNAHPGDTWRSRYESLALHTPTIINNLPFMPMPTTYPKYLPKDKWASWIDWYHEAMDLNVWLSTEFLSGVYDEAEGRWHVRLLRADGSIRELCPTHLVLAIGMFGKPIRPELAGLSSFDGEVIQPSEFKSAAGYTGKRVLVVGAATSACDAALDMYHNGAEVVMAQRGPATIESLEVAALCHGYLGDMSHAEAEQRISTRITYPVIVERMKAYTQLAKKLSAEMHEGLRRAGLRLTWGEDETGFLMKTYRDRGGYYLDMGAAQVIIDGGIKILQLADADRFVHDGLSMKDGTTMPFDTVVLATGYKNVVTEIEKMLGHQVADRVGLVGGFGPDGEIRNLCRATGQEHLWIVFGGVVDARRASKLLALQIKANLEGLVPSRVRNPDGSLTAVTRTGRKGPRRVD